MICFEKSADSAYFSHNGGQSTLSGKGKVDFFWKPRNIINHISSKTSIQKSARVGSLLLE